jgi:hypothetical protein
MTARLSKGDIDQYGAVDGFLNTELTRNLGLKTDRSCKICCFDSCDTLRAQNVSERHLKEEVRVDELAIHPP